MKAHNGSVQGKTIKHVSVFLVWLYPMHSGKRRSSSKVQLRENGDSRCRRVASVCKLQWCEQV